MIARLTRLAVLATMVAALGAASFGGVASAGGEVETDVAPLTMVKTVTGPVPAGTTFTATIQCDGDIIDTDEGDTDVATVTFAADGQPTSADTVSFSEAGSCIVTETVNGGATTTTYSCVGEHTDGPRCPRRRSRLRRRSSSPTARSVRPTDLRPTRSR